MFLSSYENNIDKKGRVSVPASFRSHISSMGFNSFIAYPSFSNKSLECCTQDRIEKILGLKVNIINKKNNSGRVTIQYKDLDQFELISDLLTKH